jgi:hypothetical protein
LTEPSFTDPRHTERDTAVMRDMLARMRAAARGWCGASVTVREVNEGGLRTWIRVPDREALFAVRELTTVGFFGQARSDVDHDPLHAIEEQIVETLEEVPGILSYFNLELPGKRYGNLVLCAGPDVPVHWHAHELHRRAVGMAPRHYHSARLHVGVVRSPLLGDGDLVVLRTRYYDFGCEPAGAAPRESS